MIEPRGVLLLAQADGFGMNGVTLGVITAVVASLAGTITLLWRYATSKQDHYIGRLEKENERLEHEKQELTDALIDSLRTGHRATDVAVDAASELLKRQARKPR